MRRIATLGLLGLLLIGSSPTALAGDRTASDTSDIVAVPSVCDGAFDPYSATTTKLADCKVQAFPLVETTYLKDGGVTYRYDVGGENAWINVPPIDFDPERASQAELDFYGYPSTPAAADQAAMDEWQRQVRSTRSRTVPPALLSVPRAKAATSGHWAGYVNTGSSSAYTLASATFKVPTPSGSPPSGCSGGGVFLWAGLGGYNPTGELAQNGLGQGAPGVGMNQAWWEILPKYKSVVTVPFFGTTGSNFTAYTKRNSGSYTFFWWNAATDDSYALNVSSLTYDGSTADYILERPVVNLVPMKLEWMSGSPVTSFRAYANGSPIGALPKTAINMKNTTTQAPIATPGTAHATDTFDMFQQGCQ